MTSINRIILIAAPSCCGKSTLISKLVDNGLDSIAQELRMGDPSDWTYVDAFYFRKNTLTRLAGRGASNVVVHWTIPRPGLKIGLRNLLLFNAYDKKDRIDVLRAAQEISVVTLFNSRDNLIRHVQFRSKRIRELREKRQDGVFLSMGKILAARSLSKFYSRRENMIPMYEKWFGFCETLNPREEFLVDLSASQTTLMPQSQWPDIRADWKVGD